MKRTILLLAVAMAAVFAVSCGDDKSTTTAPCALCACDGSLCSPSLKTREAVLVSIENAYNKRRVDWYDSLLDNNFTFYLAPSDVGGPIPEAWDRSAEVSLSAHLFDKNYSVLPCQSIYMNIKWDSAPVWTEIDASGEAWYSTVLYYDFKFEISPNTFIPNTGSKAEFVVRNTGTTQSPQWKLVEMRDLGGASLFNATSRATEPTTWGQVKAMYR